MEPGDRRTGLTACAQPPAPAPDGLRGLPELWHTLRHDLGRKLREVPGWFKPRSDATDAAVPGRRGHAPEGALASDGPPPPRHSVWAWLRRTLSVALGAALVMFLWAAVLEWIDPFGLSRNAERYSEHLNARLEAPFYASRAQGDIVMVLVTPDTLKHRGYAWPPRYEYYADAIRRILYDAPRAVFVDVLVRQARTEDTSLDYARQELDAITRETGIPVLFGTETPGAPSLFSDAHGVDVAPLAWQGAGDDYPLRLADHNIVPWSRADVPQRPLTDIERESVALRLYRLACPGMLEGDPLANGAAKPLPGCNPARKPWTLPAQPAPMVVRWGQQRPWPGSNFPGPHINACFAQSPDPGLAWRLGRVGDALATGLLSGLFPDAVEASRERCPYTLTVAEHQLEELPPGFLEDRIVMVAVDLPGVEDSVITPVHQRIAGGYLHAMALDNLMHLGGDYRYRDDDLSLVVSALAGLALCLVLAVILRCHRRGRPIVRWSLLTAAGIAVSLATWRALDALNLPAPNWVVAAALFVYATWRVTTTMRVPVQSQPGAPP